MEISRLEEERITALQKADVVAYARLCDEMGIDPELPEFYELGQMEISRAEKRLSELECMASAPGNSDGKKARKRHVNPLTYLKFYSNGIKLGTNIGKNDKEKRNLLLQYFPGQFGDNGREPLKNKDAVYVCAKFNHVMNSARKYAQA